MMHFKEQRDGEGLVCKRCQRTDHYWLQNNGVMSVNLVDQDNP